MDRLPLTLAAACVRVDHVHVTRIVDAAKRRAPLRAKVGAGLTVEEFEPASPRGASATAGSPSPARSSASGWGCRSTTSARRSSPVVADRPGIPAGRVAGLRQSAVGVRGGREIVRLDLEMSIAAPDPRDAIVIQGDPPLDVVIRGGTHGDRGTVGTVLSAIPAVIAAPPGLKTILDLALVA